MDKLDLYKRGIGLSVTDLDEAEKRMMNTYRQEYRDKGFIGGFKESLRIIGIMQEAKGGMNLFKNIDQVIMDDDYLLNKSVRDMNLGGHLIGDLDKYMANYHTSNFKYQDEVGANVDFQKRIDLDLASMYNQSQKFNTTKRFSDIGLDSKEAVYDSLHILRVAGDDDFIEQYGSDIFGQNAIKDGEAYIQFRNDVGSLSLLFADDPDMAVRAYRDSLKENFKGGRDMVEGFEVNEETVQKFRESMNNETFRNKFAAALLLRHGALSLSLIHI